MVSLRDYRGVAVEVGEEGVMVRLIRDVVIPGIDLPLKKGWAGPMTLLGGGRLCLDDWAFNVHDLQGAFELASVPDAESTDPESTDEGAKEEPTLAPGLYEVTRNLTVHDVLADGDSRSRTTWYVAAREENKVYFTLEGPPVDGVVPCVQSTERGVGKADYPSIKRVTFKAKVEDILSCCTLVEPERKGDPWADNVVDAIVGLLKDKKPGVTEATVRAFVEKL